MKNINLNLPESPVVFEHEHHTYNLNGRMLSGVTAIVKWLFPDTYAGIPESVLMQAADYGTLIHSKCELADSMGIADDAIVEQYLRIIKDAGLQVAVSEYLVSDLENVASSIDKVFVDDSLGDIKTTSKIHWVNVTVQLSIYAYLYECQTGRKANKLYVIWLPKPQYGVPMVKELTRIPDFVCEAMITEYVTGESNEGSLKLLSHYINLEYDKRTKGEIPDGMQETIEELMMVKQRLDELGEREKELKKQILTAMQNAGEDSWCNDIIQFSRKAAYERESIDTKALKEKMPDVYESFRKVTKVAESISYKLL